MIERLVPLLGFFVMLFLGWTLSSQRRRIAWRVVLGGTLLQFGFAYLVLKTAWGREFFQRTGAVITALLDCVDAGAVTVFGPGFKEHFFAFKVLPTIIFFSAFMSFLYYLKIMPWLVRGIAWVMQKTLGTSGAETLSCAGNIFVGQTEAPLLVRPYINEMTDSEIMAVMVGGFATIAGGVMAAYIGFGIPPSHLLTASVISAPAALVVAKLLQPEVEQPKTLGVAQAVPPSDAVNVIDAIARGTSDGLWLALNVAAMLIAFTALLSALNSLLAWLGQQANVAAPITLENLLGTLCLPLTWCMGFERQDCRVVSDLLGLRIVTNEFIVYSRIGEQISAGKLAMSPRSLNLITYALCGFANFASIGIQIGGIGALAPARRGTLARLGLRAMLGGLLASYMTTCVAALLL